MKRIFYLGLLYLVFLSSCKGQGQNNTFNQFLLKHFTEIQLPVRSDTLRSGNGLISEEDIRKFFSNTQGTFYGKVDSEGYAPYEYFSPSWRFKRNENITCLIYASMRYGGQDILATYRENGELMDTLVFITGIDLGPDHDLYQVFTIDREFKIKVVKLTDECIRHSKYDSARKIYTEPLFKGQVDTMFYKIDENGKFRYLSTITRKGLLFMNSKSGKVEVDSVKAGLKKI